MLASRGLIIFAVLVVAASAFSPVLRKFANQHAEAKRSVDVTAFTNNAGDAQVQCFVYSCVGLGANCSILFNASFDVTYAPYCTGGTTCPDDPPEVCQLSPPSGLPTNGQVCNTTDGCEDPYDCNEYSLTCVSDEVVLAAGSPCSSNSDCKHTNHYQTCASGVCQGNEPGQSCTSSDDCNGFSECDYITELCKTPVFSGAACTSSDTCVGGSCISGKCVSSGSVASGGTCDETLDCGDGLYCGSDAVCVAPVASGQSCSDSTQCGRDQTCACSYATGNAICSNEGPINPSGSAAARQAYYNCIISNKVYDEHNSLLKCKSAFCGASNIAANSYLKLIEDQYPACVANDLKSQISFLVPATCKSNNNNDAHVVAASSVFAVLAALVASVL